MENNIYLFTQTNCAPCVALKYKMQEEGIQVQVFTLEEDRERFTECGVTSTPTLLKLGNDGQEIERISGKATLEDEEFNTFFGK